MDEASGGVSVVIPVFNGAPYIAEAIASVQAQTRGAAEIVVVDDGSTDGGGEIAQGLADVRVARQSQAGQAAARNHGARLARGEWLAFLDADDLWAPRKLELQLAALARDPELAMVFGHAVQFRDGRAPASEAALPAHLPGAMLLRRSMFARIGGYRGEWKVGEVVEWYARALDLGLKSVCLPEVVLYRRIHGDNLGVRESGARHHSARALKHVLDRRRAGAAQAVPK